MAYLYTYVFTFSSHNEQYVGEQCVTLRIRNISVTQENEKKKKTLIEALLTPPSITWIKTSHS